MLSTQASTCLAGLLISSSGSRIGTHPGLQCPRGRSHPVARSHRRRTSLMSSLPHLSGVTVGTSRSIKPRERGLRNRSRLLFCPEILRGQPDFHDMPPALQTISRNQYAPVFWESASYGARRVRQGEIWRFSLAGESKTLQTRASSETRMMSNTTCDTNRLPPPSTVGASERRLLL